MSPKPPKPKASPPPPKAPPPPPPSTTLRQCLLGAFAAAAVVLFLNRPPSPHYILCSPTHNIYTVDDAHPRVDCIAVRGARIYDSGALADIQSRSWAAPYTDLLPSWARDFLTPRVVTVHEDSIVVPGLADAHAHFIENGYMMQLPLIDTLSVQDVVDRIKAYILAHSEVHNDTSAWIEGMGWDQTKWPGKAFPTAADLDTDPLLKDRLISLSRIDGHAKWVSPAVLRLLGNDLPSEVDGGLIVRDADGNPTGIFVDNAMDLLPLPEWSDARMEAYFATTLEDALSHGLTSVHDADSQPHYVRFMKKKADEGKLPIRIYMMGYIPALGYWGDRLTRLVNYGKHGRLNMRAIKLFTDGALGSWGAALLAPYTDKPDTSGILRIPKEELRRLVKRFWRDGWQVNIHCIGDLANHAVLDIYEELLTAEGGADAATWRPRIEHAQIMTWEDLARVGRLGVIASVQPKHATSDMWYAESRLGPKRIKGAYAYQTLLQASPNNVLPLGSDFPVEPVNPLLTFHAAVSRLSVDGTSPHGPGGWYISQALTRAQALKGMTLDAAYASFAENDIGSLVPGKRADYVVLDRNIMTLPAEEILRAKVQATVLDGEIVWGKL